jgi:phosphoribosylformylglycinamidine synthase
MEPWEIWTSESQERMMICSRGGNVEKILKVFEREEVEAVVLGEFIVEEKLRIVHKGELTGELDIPFLFDTKLISHRKASPPIRDLTEPKIEISDLDQDLHALLSMPNIASKEKVIRTYDHEVKAQTILKPLQGLDGPGDAAVIKPLFDSPKGVVISNGMNPEYGKIDPYHMAACAIDEALRNNVCVGGRRIALLDNFCWGNPEKADRLWSLARAAEACYDVGIVYETPFISGKDSLYNESELGPVTPTLLISAVGIMPDISKAVSMDLKEPGSSIYLVGLTKNELGGSHFYKLKGHLGKNVPVVNPHDAKKSFKGITAAIDNGIVNSCHDLSEGGLAVAAAEMAFAGDVGLKIDLSKIPTNNPLKTEALLFSESQSRFLIEVHDSDKFESIMMGTVCSKIGKSTETKRLMILDDHGKVIDEELSRLRRSWQNGF